RRTREAEECISYSNDRERAGLWRSRGGRRRCGECLPRHAYPNGSRTGRSRPQLPARARRPKRPRMERRPRPGPQERRLEPWGPQLEPRRRELEQRRRELEQRRPGLECRQHELVAWSPRRWWRDGDLPRWGFWGAPPAVRWSGPPPWGDPHPINYWGY